MKAENKIQRDFFVLLSTKHKVNQPWLENQAIEIEEALDGCPDICGPSVTANFDENGFELDLTVQATSMAETYERLGQALRIVEETAGIKVGAASAGEVRSAYESAEQPDHETAELTPA